MVGNGNLKILISKENGKEINYTITEEKVEGYYGSKRYDGMNSYTPGKQDLLTKVWEDKMTKTE